MDGSDLSPPEQYLYRFGAIAAQQAYMPAVAETSTYAEGRQMVPTLPFPACTDPAYVT
jgi:hypothetical protein